MDDVRAVEQVLLDYFDGVDRRDPEAAVSVFAPDARAEIMTGKVLEGRDRIGRALGRVLVRYARTSHHPTNARVELDGDTATLRTYVYAFHRMTTGDVWHLWARLYDRMERRDGRWWIVDHRLTGVDSDPHRPDIGDEWYGGHAGHLAAGPIPVQSEIARQALADAVPGAGTGLSAAPRRGAERRRHLRRAQGAVPSGGGRGQEPPGHAAGGDGPGPRRRGPGRRGLGRGRRSWRCREGRRWRDASSLSLLASYGLPAAPESPAPAARP